MFIFICFVSLIGIALFSGPIREDNTVAFVDERLRISFSVGDFSVPEVANSNLHPLNNISLQKIDETYYLFLPYWAVNAPITPYITGEFTEFQLNDEQLVSGVPLSARVYNGKRFDLLIDGESFPLITMVGSEVPTLFIFTESETLDYVHETQEHRETTTFLFVDQFGHVEHVGTGDINGRGNWTWTQPKRPYNIRLAEGIELPLFGLRPGRHWTLLTNHGDNTLVRNQVSLYLARELDLMHTSRLVPVELFINNQYVGLYDFVERRNLNHVVSINDMDSLTTIVNSAPLSMFPQHGINEPIAGSLRYFDIPHNPPDITGDYLLEVQLYHRFGNGKSSFVSERGIPVILRSPEYATRRQIDYISEFYQNLENALFSPTGYNELGQHFSEFLDLESFAMMYLLHEFVMDFDTARTSFFFIKTSALSGSGRLYAGVPWDFDNTFGSRRDTSYTDALFANGGRPASTLEGEVPHILTVLNQHEEFLEVVAELWQAEFAPVIRVLLSETEYEPNGFFRPMHFYIDRIADSRTMNHTLWPRPRAYITDIISWSQARYRFLDSLWGESEEAR